MATVSIEWQDDAGRILRQWRHPAFYWVIGTTARRVSEDTQNINIVRHKMPWPGWQWLLVLGRLVGSSVDGNKHKRFNVISFPARCFEFLGPKKYGCSSSKSIQQGIQYAMYVAHVLDFRFTHSLITYFIIQNISSSSNISPSAEYITYTFFYIRTCL